MAGTKKGGATSNTPLLVTDQPTLCLDRQVLLLSCRQHAATQKNAPQCCDDPPPSFLNICCTSCLHVPWTTHTRRINQPSLKNVSAPARPPVRLHSDPFIPTSSGQTYIQHASTGAACTSTESGRLTDCPLHFASHHLLLMPSMLLRC